jgi:CheY-like chemotaxis protein
LKILIIEDEVGATSMLTALLGDSHEILVAYTGKDAIKIGLKSKPNLIISDWDLKDEIDGIEACRQILEHHKAIVIFVSGSPVEQLKEAAEALAPLHVLTKPLNLSYLSALIQQIGDDSKGS